VSDLKGSTVVNIVLTKGAVSKGVFFKLQP
jgi:hypothetical protein